MCGISGIVNQSGNSVSEVTIQEMNDLIEHRGPDDQGIYLGNTFGFGHRRLSILDLSPDGHQPMHFKERYTITYNGEVYNYLELKDELKEFGYSFISHTDTEVILAAYDHWGEKCVEKFNGMWAFAIYDKSMNTIFLSRDRFGIKPLYYTQVDNQFIFGSEIKQLLYFFQENVINKKVLLDYLVTGALDYNNETFFKNIYKLEESHNMLYNLSDNTFSVKKYYNILKHDKLKKKDLDISVNDYEEEFSRSIAYRLRSDVKVGTCLSGGLDSSTVAVYASGLYNTKSDEKFCAIHAKSTEAASDESSYAKLVAEASNIDLNIIEPSKEDFINNIDEVVYTQEEPFGGPSIFMQYFVMQKANELGIKVMLDGQGGDETLLGYNKYFVLYIGELLKSLNFKSLFKEIKNIKENSSQGLLQILMYFFGMTLGRLRLEVHKKEVDFIKKESLSLSKYEFIHMLSSASNNDFLLQEVELCNTNLPVLLRHEDKNSMRHSIETRLPFIDYKVVEQALNTNINYKIKNGWTKYLLRKMIDSKLGTEVVWRKNKLGFNAPDNTWLDSIMEDMEKEILLSPILKNICDMNKLEEKYNSLSLKVKWRLYNIAVWERVYNVKYD